MPGSYIEFSFIVTPQQPATDILLAQLGAFAFDSFVETDEGLLAYIKKEDLVEEEIQKLQIIQHPDFEIRYTKKEIPQQNWNARWEQNFKPIKIDNRCLVRAPFHTPPSDVIYDIIIEPKMSFGTGHHETTQMMLEHLLEQAVTGLSVLDMGTGTGVLAIMAAMKGASHVDAIDIDSWSYLNAKENINRNAQPQISIYEGDVGLLSEQKYDFILANINRNILLADIPVYAQHLNYKGTLILSGFYQEDLPLITKKCEDVQLRYLDKRVKNNWVAGVYKKD